MSPASRNDKIAGWTWVHTTLAVAVWVLGWIPPAGLAAWLYSAHDWPQLVTVGVFIAGYLPILTTGYVVLFAHAEPRAAASATGAVDPERRGHEARSALALSGALAAVGVGGIAAVVGLMYLMGYLARWLHGSLGLPEPIAGILGTLVVLGGLIGTAITASIRFDGRPGLRDDATFLTVPDDAAGHAVGPRKRDQLLVEDVESVTGRRVRTVIRTAETVLLNLDWAAEEEFWDLLFALESGEGIRCDAHGATETPAPRAAELARGYKKRGYHDIETLAWPGDEAVAATAPESHHVVWTQLDRRWTIEIMIPVSLTRNTGISLLRCAADRFQRLTATGALPVPAATSPSELALRLPEPLRADDFIPILGYPADPIDKADVVRHPSRSATGWWDDYWYEEFYLRGGEVAVGLRVHGVRGDTELLACDRQAWTQLGQSRPVEIDGYDAFLVEGGSPFEHDDDRRSLWVSVGDQWAMQVVASRGVADAQLASLAKVVIARLGTTAATAP